MLSSPTWIAFSAATAALGDKDFVRESRELNRKGLADLCKGLERLQLPYIPSAGNFVSFATAIARLAPNATRTVRLLSEATGAVVP